MEELFISADKNDVSFSEHFERFEKYVTANNLIDFGASYKKPGTHGIKYARKTRVFLVLAIVFFVLSLASQVYNIVALNTTAPASVGSANPLGIWLYIIEIVFFVTTVIFYLVFLVRNKKQIAKSISNDFEFEREAFISAQEQFSIPDDFQEIGVLEAEAKTKGAEVIYDSHNKFLLLERRLIYSKDSGVSIADYETEYTIPLNVLIKHELVDTPICFISFDKAMAESSDVKMYNLTCDKYKYTLGSYGKFVFKDSDGEFEIKVLPNDFHKVLRLFIPQDQF
ncbi:MAG: hypothetical protein LBF68_05385 [Christensenellaceae bacterium]|jgi:hypothetical protein|nr:hypothetical protein [Christensenellaceae bacterium]